MSQVRGVAPVPPLFEGVEDKLGAAEGILAPARDLIVHRQAQALLEVWARVRDVAPYEPLHLQHAIMFWQETPPKQVQAPFTLRQRSVVGHSSNKILMTVQVNTFFYHVARQICPKGSDALDHCLTLLLWTLRACLVGVIACL